MKAVQHALAQCYVKEPLLYLFSVSDVKKGSVVSIKLECDDELSRVVSLQSQTPLYSRLSQVQITQMSQDLILDFIFKASFLL